MKRRARAAILTAALACALGAWHVDRDARAQRIEPARPKTLTVGGARALQGTDRVDGRRHGATRARLPTHALRVAWKRNFGQIIEHTPLVTGDANDVAVIVNYNELVVLAAADGAERSRTLLGSGNVGPPAALADGTIVAVVSSGEVVGVLRGVVRFRTRLHGGGRPVVGRVSPLPLDDGGIIVGATTELVALDADGGVRARAPVPEPLVGPLLAGADQAIAVAASGNVYGWSPGREVKKLGSFGQWVDGGAAVLGGGSLLAVTGAAQLTALDLRRGTTAALASAPTGLYLGPPAILGTTAYVLGVTQAHTFLVGLDDGGREVTRTGLGSAASLLSADGGAPVPSAVGARAGPLVDAAGTVAFATPDAQLGVASPSGGVQLLTETPWAARMTAASSHRTSAGGVIGMAPLPNGFVAASDAGTVLAVAGGGP